MIDREVDHQHSRRYRILSLDGGGVKGTYTAAVLSTLETLTGKSISQHFDLIAGTSTGGILAIAIGLGIPLSKVLDLYVVNGPEIFPPPATGRLGKAINMLRHCLRPKHSQEVLQKALVDVLGNRKFGESQNRLVIPAFNAVNGNVHLFKTAHRPKYKMDFQRPVIEVALATAAAPTFFHAFKDVTGQVFLDGGLWANCPAMVAIVEAVAVLGWPLDQLDVLSIGTTEEPVDVSHDKRRGGLIQWNRSLVEVPMTAQQRGSLALAQAMLKGRLLRVDVVSRPGRFSLDNSREVSELRALGENSARQLADEVDQKFFGRLADKFEPCNELSPAVSAT